MTARRFALALGAIGLAALAVRVVYTLIADPVVPEVSDASAYHLLGRNLADGRGYIRPFDLTILDRVRPTAEYPPLFPGLLGVASFLGIGSVDGQRLLTCVVGAGGVALVGLVGRRVGGPTVGLVAAGIAAVHPLLFQNDAVLMAESLFVPLVAAVLLLALRAGEQPTLWRLAALGATIGLATLTRGEALLLVPLLALPFVLRRRPLAAALVVAAALAVVLPWTVRNTVRFGEVVPVSNNVGTALAGANCDETYGGDRIGLWVYDCFGGFDQAAADEAEAAAESRRKGLDFALDNPERWPAVAAARCARTWGLFRPTQLAFVASFEGRSYRWEMLGTRLHWVLLPLAVAGAVVLRRRRDLVWPLLATWGMVSVTTVATYGNQRFRAGAEPAIAVLAAVALVALLGRIRHRPYAPGP